MHADPMRCCNWIHGPTLLPSRETHLKVRRLRSSVQGNLEIRAYLRREAYRARQILRRSAVTMWDTYQQPCVHVLENGVGPSNSHTVSMGDACLAIRD